MSFMCFAKHNLKDIKLNEFAWGLPTKAFQAIVGIVGECFVVHVKFKIITFLNVIHSFVQG
ncbi:hypothetical protein ACJIZ3_023971 [Penstemon smallii]|uniref:Uncharacterized protein n=1 Tax=Penstemon smallii TaxID=265156 RepID=A0ABD3TSV3_9LAMI